MVDFDSLCTVKAINHCAQNRPVHLALRDAYFEEAARLISSQNNSFGPGIRIEAYEDILALLRSAREHARFSIRDGGLNEQDEQFGRFINMLAGNVKAILSMLNLKGMVENSAGSCFSFLGANQASVALQAEEYQRRANDIVRSIHKTLQLAETPFGQLKADNARAATEEEMERYEKAHRHCHDQIRTGAYRGGIASNYRTRMRR